MAHLLDCYQHVGILGLNNVEGKMGPKDVALISGLEVTFPTFRPHLENDE